VPLLSNFIAEKNFSDSSGLTNSKREKKTSQKKRENRFNFYIRPCDGGGVLTCLRKPEE
jgi:hypothetical protein